MKTIPQRRHDRLTHIKRRRKMIAGTWYTEQKHIADGKLANGHEVSAALTQGHSRKTNTRKSHSDYRSKGGFGEANKYTPHDKRQMQSTTDEEIREQIRNGVSPVVIKVIRRDPHPGKIDSITITYV